MESQHTKSMSEIGEMPSPAPVEVQEPPRKRLEDMPEFKKLAPEQQEKLLALREHMMAEASNPERVVTRSIGEMGFWEGMKETMKPHMAKSKELAFKELKAGASLTISLIPILGEGKGLGTGLLGLGTKEAPLVLSGATKLSDLKNGFEPAVRLSKAFSKGKEVASATKAVKSADMLWDMSKGSRGLEKAAFKVAYGLDKTGAVIQDVVRPVTSILAGKDAATHVLGQEFSKSAKEGSNIMAARFGVDKIQDAQHAKAAAKAAAFAGVKADVAAKNAVSGEWYKFPVRWARSAGGEVRANVASMKAGKKAGEAVTEAVKGSVKRTGVAGFVEGGVKRAAPTAIEATRFGKFHAFFDRWLNLTPDVPLWISTTTGVMEFLGAHGIDAVPAVMQMAVNRYQSIKLSMAAAKDVLAYTTGRVLQKAAERQIAANTFEMAPVPAAA